MINTDGPRRRPCLHSLEWFTFFHFLSCAGELASNVLTLLLSHRHCCDFWWLLSEPNVPANTKTKVSCLELLRDSLMSPWDIEPTICWSLRLLITTWSIKSHNGKCWCHTTLTHCLEKWQVVRGVKLIICSSLLLQQQDGGHKESKMENADAIKFMQLSLNCGLLSKNDNDTLKWWKLLNSKWSKASFSVQGCHNSLDFNFSSGFDRRLTVQHGFTSLSCLYPSKHSKISASGNNICSTACPMWLFVFSYTENDSFAASSLMMM